MQSLEKIQGVGPQTAKTLVDRGFPDVRAVAEASAAELATVPGFSEARAMRVIQAAQALLSTGEAAPASPNEGSGSTPPGSEPAGKSKERKKKGKKDKSGKAEKKGKKGKKPKKDKKGKKGKKADKKSKKGGKAKKG